MSRGERRHQFITISSFVGCEGRLREELYPQTIFSKERQIEWEKRDFEAKKEAQESGLDYEREY